MSHPGHNDPWRAQKDWGYRVKYDTDKQLHEHRQQIKANAREAERSAAYWRKRRGSKGGRTSVRRGGGLFSLLMLGALFWGLGILTGYIGGFSIGNGLFLTAIGGLWLWWRLRRKSR
ncbi:hypothetical protein [Mesorhizobium sp. CAU 1741]|uniref:hypothetical protein n=1 Tax=Mesorhizobium sp. CAU 1741 TaxID=3140366 RepID=UPI00325BF4F8